MCNTYVINIMYTDTIQKFFMVKPIDVQMINDIYLKESQFPGNSGRGVHS